LDEGIKTGRELQIVGADAEKERNICLPLNSHCSLPPAPASSDHTTLYKFVIIIIIIVVVVIVITII